MPTSLQATTKRRDARVGQALLGSLVILTFALSGCSSGGGGDDETEPTPAPPPAPTPAPPPGAPPPPSPPALTWPSDQVSGPTRLALATAGHGAKTLTVAQAINVTGVVIDRSSGSVAPVVVVIHDNGPRECGALPEGIHVWSSRLDAPAILWPLSAGNHTLQVWNPAGLPVEVQFGVAAEAPEPREPTEAAAASAPREVRAFIDASSGTPATSSFEEALTAIGPAVFVGRFDPAAQPYTTSSWARSAVRGPDGATCMLSEAVGNGFNANYMPVDVRAVVPPGSSKWIGASESPLRTSGVPAAFGDLIPLAFPPVPVPPAPPPVVEEG